MMQLAISLGYKPVSYQLGAYRTGPAVSDVLAFPGKVKPEALQEGACFEQTRIPSKQVFTVG